MPHFTVNFGSQRDPANNFSGRVRTKEAWATAGKANALHFPASDSRSNNSGLNVAQDLAADELVASENHSRIRRQKLLSHKLVMGQTPRRPKSRRAGGEPRGFWNSPTRQPPRHSRWGPAAHLPHARALAPDTATPRHATPLRTPQRTGALQHWLRWGRM